jgi:hypothetical protein
MLRFRSVDRTARLKFSAPVLLAVVLLVPLCAGADIPATPPLTASEIAARMIAADDARMPKLRDYTSLRHYTLDNKRFGVRASMTVRVYYQYPGTKQFEVIEESGPSALRKRVFHRMLDSELQASEGLGREETRISPRNYEFRLAGTRIVEGRKCFILDVTPKTKNPLLFEGVISVDAEDYAVTSFEGTPAQNPSFWLRKTTILHKYGKIGQFWLPISNDSNSEVKMFGNTEVRIDYSDYKINTAAQAATATEPRP